jgi:hypothetical protein
MHRRSIEDGHNTEGLATMLTKTKIALAMAIVAATSSVALADGEFDPNLANRYPGYAESRGAQHTFRSAPVLMSAPLQMRTRNTALPARQSVSPGLTQFEVDQSDRASSPYRGGGY